MTLGLHGGPRSYGQRRSCSPSSVPRSMPWRLTLSLVFLLGPGSCVFTQLTTFPLAEAEREAICQSIWTLSRLEQDINCSIQQMFANHPLHAQAKALSKELAGINGAIEKKMAEAIAIGTDYRGR